MKRLTYEALENLAVAHNAPIEIDSAEGIAVVKIGRKLYVASLPAGVAK